jgi:cytochrome c peroxidase
MTARRAFAPAILFAVFLSFPATSQTSSNPPPPFPRLDDERALSDLQLLGKRLFEDTNLSEPRGQACSSCHRPQARVPGQ